MGNVITTVMMVSTASGSLERSVHLAIGSGLLLVALALARLGERVPGLLLGILPLLSAFAMTGVTLGSGLHGTPYLAHSWLIVLYASLQLPVGRAGLCLTVCTVGTTLITLQQEPVVPALTESSSSAGVMAVTTFCLVRGRAAQRKLSQMLREQATVDPLTGLVNRRVLDEAVRSLGAAGPDQAGNALILIDLDNFKAINDGYGHPSGDEALVHVASLVRANTRRTDVLCRLGGDEFALLMTDCGADDAIAQAERILKTIRASPLKLSGGVRLELAVSIGVAHLRPSTQESADLYEATDVSLYSAKRAGRNQVGALAG